MDFTKRFTNYTNVQLLKVIDNPEEYQIKAVEIAREILQKRHLTDEERTEAKNTLKLAKEAYLEKENKKIEINTKIKNATNSIIKSIHPIQNEEPSVKNTIRTITIAFTLLFIVHACNDLGYVKFMLTDSYTSWDISDVIYIFPLILLPLAAFQFYNGIKYGWYLLTVYSCYQATSLGTFFIHDFKWLTSAETSHFYNLFQPTPSIKYILSFLIFTSIVFVLSKKELRSIYSISNKALLLTISSTSIITLSGLFLLLF